MKTFQRIFIATIRTGGDWSVLTLVLFGILTNLTLDRLQAGQEADEMAELRQTFDPAVQAIAVQRTPDSPERTERLKCLNEEIGQEIQRLHRKYD
jgi:hypothetical protein